MNVNYIDETQAQRFSGPNPSGKDGSDLLVPLASELDLLLQERRLTPVFQPIITLNTGKILGYEALIRGPGNSSLESPAQLFATARAAGRLAVLEYACREVSCERFVALDLPGKLFLNMSPLSFTDRSYREGVTREILARMGLDPERVVFELTEREPVDKFHRLQAASEHFRQQGFALALDDLGAGYSGLRVWSELRPEYVKIDRHFISGIDTDPVKREFVRAMLEIAHRLGNCVIAEGIEQEAELITLANLGVDCVQGFYLVRPQANPPRSLKPGLPERLGYRHRQYDHFLRTLGELVQYVEPVSPMTPTVKIVERFRSEPSLACLPVVEGDRPLGMVSRNELLHTFSHRYSYELHAHKPIERFICQRSLLMDIDCELKEAGQLLTEDPQQNLSVDLLICCDGRYAGIVPVRRLLRSITEEKMRLARHSNPLTQLPGNVPLYEWIDHLLQKGQPFCVAYCDINHFKPFNDAFGYSRGDDVIVALGQMLSEQADPNLDFVGHVGGDDFILVCQSPDWRERCQAVLEQFEQLGKGFLPGGQTSYASQDRQGRRRQFGGLTLSIGCVQPDPALCQTHHQVSQLLAAAKHSAKAIGGSSLFESRRRVPE